MTGHTWITEEVDGGSLGVNDCWQCSVCGACGGPVFGQRRPWPFIPGPAQDVSEDCVAAQIEILHYVNQRIEALAQMGPKGVSPKYAEMLRQAVDESQVRDPRVTNLIPLVSLFYLIEYFKLRPTLDKLRDQLVELGFRS